MQSNLNNSLLTSVEFEVTIVNGAIFNCVNSNILPSFTLLHANIRHCRMHKRRFGMNSPHRLPWQDLAVNYSNCFNTWPCFQLGSWQHTIQCLGVSSERKRVKKTDLVQDVIGSINPKSRLWINNSYLLSGILFYTRTYSLFVRKSFWCLTERLKLREKSWMFVTFNTTFDMYFLF